MGTGTQRRPSMFKFGIDWSEQHHNLCIRNDHGAIVSQLELKHTLADFERLALPDDWRERLEELVEDRPEREDLDAKRRYIQGRLRRLREVYVDGDLGRTEYARRRDELRAQLVALEEPEPSEVEHAAETLETRGTEWAGASKRLRRAMLRVIFEGIYCDMIERRVVYVRPYPAFVPLFRMDGMEQREDGNFYPKEDGQQA
jgi:hypothetical protein